MRRQHVNILQWFAARVLHACDGAQEFETGEGAHAEPPQLGALLERDPYLVPYKDHIAARFGCPLAHSP